MTERMTFDDALKRLQIRMPLRFRWRRWARNWCWAIGVFAVTCFAVAILLPVLRTWPLSVHKYCMTLPIFMRYAFIFALCVVAAHVLCKLLSPRLKHLRYLHVHPPLWFACLAGLTLAAILDLKRDPSLAGYQGTLFEWLLLPGLSIAAVWVARWLFAQPGDSQAAVNRSQDVDWAGIKLWLEDDRPAIHDLLGNEVVANRLSDQIRGGAEAIGIGGPFGVGKTTVVQWLKDDLERNRIFGRDHLVSIVSCWGLETSGASIHEMLAGAVARIGEDIDAALLRSLPESYIRSLSGGEKWIKAIAGVVLESPNRDHLLSRLDQILDDLDAHLVLVVEDLDRNDSGTFEQQEVLAFLHKLKQLLNVSFVLTGGTPAEQKTDYEKFCDHIEVLKTLNGSSVNVIVELVFKQCANRDPKKDGFRQDSLTHSSMLNLFDPKFHEHHKNPQPRKLIDTVASLLDTPRKLRHALARTHRAWQPLCGEVDWNHLFAVNVLRYGAPEALEFMQRNQAQMQDHHHLKPEAAKRENSRTSQEIIGEWRQFTAKIEQKDTKQNLEDATVIMEFLWPVMGRGLAEANEIPDESKPIQTVLLGKYWHRAIDEVISDHEVRDQTVIEETRKWERSSEPDPDSVMVEQLCSSAEYERVWRQFAPRIFHREIVPGNLVHHYKIPMLWEQVLQEIGKRHGSSASGSSLGFQAILELRRSCTLPLLDGAVWLRRFIDDAFQHSLELVNAIWQHFAADAEAMISDAERPELRSYLEERLRETITNGKVLGSILSERTPYALDHLISRGARDTDIALRELAKWRWLAPHITEAIEIGDTSVAINVARLLSEPSYNSESDEFWDVNEDRLFALFDGDAGRIMQLMGATLPEIQNEYFRKLVDNLIRKATLAVSRRESNDK